MLDAGVVGPAFSVGAGWLSGAKEDRASTANDVDSPSVTVSAAGDEVVGALDPCVSAEVVFSN